MDAYRLAELLAEGLGAASVAAPRRSRYEDSINCLIAIGVSVVGSALTVVGFILQKQANDGPARCKIGDVAISVKWIVGFVFGMLLPIPLQVWAYSYAPMSLLSPLSGVSVALNMAFTPCMLGEQLQRWPDVPASIFILAGTLFTSLAGPRHNKSFTFGELLSLLSRTGFIWALIVLMLTIFGCISFMNRRRREIEESAKARPTNPSILYVVLPALVAASCGCLSNISLKASGELLKGGAESFECLFWLLSAGVSALVQLNYVNRGLRLYLQTVFFPVYSALLILTNTFYGLIFYNEYGGLLAQANRSAGFSLGIGCIVVGIFMFRLRRSDDSAVAHLSQQLADVPLAADTELGGRHWSRQSLCGTIDSFGQEVDCDHSDLQAWHAIVD